MERHLASIQANNVGSSPTGHANPLVVERIYAVLRTLKSEFNSCRGDQFQQARYITRLQEIIYYERPIRH